MEIGLDCWHTAMTVALPSFMESLLSPLVRPLSSVYVRIPGSFYFTPYRYFSVWRGPVGLSNVRRMSDMSRNFDGNGSFMSRWAMIEVVKTAHETAHERTKVSIQFSSISLSKYTVARIEQIPLVSPSGSSSKSSTASIKLLLSSNHLVQLDNQFV